MYRLAKLFVGFGLLLLLAYLFDWQQAIRALGNADPFWVMGALLISVFGVLISAWKWLGLLVESRIELPLGLAARLYWIGMFFSNFLPTSVGGDAVRLALTPADGGTGRVAGTILLERLTGVLVMLGLSLLGLALRPWTFPDIDLHRLMIIAVLGLIACGLVLLVAPALLARLLPFVIRPMPPFLRGPLHKIHGFAVTLAAQAWRFRALARALLISVPFYGTIFIAQYCVLRAVGADVPLLDVLLLGALIPLLTILPISVNGLGVAEGAFVVLYGALGVPPQLALAAAVLRRLVDLLNSSLGGLFWLSYRRDVAEPYPA